MAERTTVHLLRHGEVYNPQRILYGRLPGFPLSDLGHQMADLAAEALAGRDVAGIVSSPLERAVQTAQPLADATGLEPVLDDRVIEAENVFEGQRVSTDSVLRKPSVWRHLYNPFRPSWGEPYRQVALRMRLAVADARRRHTGHEVVIVSHQLPVWISRLDAENRSFVHDPRRRQCNLASLTSLTFEGSRLVSITYTEPAAALYPQSTKGVGA